MHDVSARDIAKPVSISANLALSKEALALLGSNATLHRNSLDSVSHAVLFR